MISNFQGQSGISARNYGNCSIWLRSTWMTTILSEFHLKFQNLRVWFSWIYRATNSETSPQKSGSSRLWGSYSFTTTSLEPCHMKWANSSSCRSSAWRAIHCLRTSSLSSVKSTELRKFYPSCWTIFPVSPTFYYFSLSFMILSAAIVYLHCSYSIIQT